jgi:catechol 2,3-dioxygenase-like lactoylglutathione lyase family enzyme
MFSHIMLGANDVQVSKQFYDAALATLGCKPGRVDDKGRCFYKTPTGIFAITQPINGEPASRGNGSTIGFAAETPEAVLAWHAAGLANGGVAIEDPPGIREGGGVRLHLAYLLDPASNKVCAMYRYPKE